MFVGNRIYVATPLRQERSARHLVLAGTNTYPPNSRSHENQSITPVIAAVITKKTIPVKSRWQGRGVERWGWNTETPVGVSGAAAGTGGGMRASLRELPPHLAAEAQRLDIEEARLYRPARGDDD